MESVLNLISHVVDLLRDPNSAVYVICVIALIVAALAIHAVTTIAKLRGK